MIPSKFVLADQVANMVEKIIAEFGRMDILVNNAGGTFFAPFLEISDNGWEATC